MNTQQQIDDSKPQENTAFAESSRQQARSASKGITPQVAETHTEHHDTAGNASGMNDASSGVILMSEEKAKEVGAPILARIVSVATTGVRPEVMGIGPISLFLLLRRVRPYLQFFPDSKSHRSGWSRAPA